MHTTSPSLIDCLRMSPDPAAWDRFVKLYSSGIYSWTRAMGLQHADAADLVQDVFAVVICRLPDFEIDAVGSFRGWLWVITRNKFRERARRKKPVLISNDALKLISDDEIEPFWEEEFQRHLVGRIVAKLKADFPPKVWQAFIAHVIDGKPASKVADELNMNIWAVYTAKVRVLAHLNKELAEHVTG